MSDISVEVVTSGKRLWGEGLVWLIGAVVCLLAATAGPMSISVGSGWSHLRCAAAAPLALANQLPLPRLSKHAVLGLPCKYKNLTFTVVARRERAASLTCDTF